MYLQVVMLCYVIYLFMLLFYYLIIFLLYISCINRLYLDHSRHANIRLEMQLMEHSSVVNLKTYLLPNRCWRRLYHKQPPNDLDLIG